jgi:hypothetical protein
VNRDDVAGPESVSSGSVGATAHRDVVGDSADGLETASAGTRVLALVADARFVHCAVRADQTLGSAALVRVSEVLGQTLACGVSSLLPADGVRAARAGVAGIRLDWLNRLCNFKIAS